VGAGEVEVLAGPIPFLRPLAERLGAARDEILGDRAVPTTSEEI